MSRNLPYDLIDHSLGLLALGQEVGDVSLDRIDIVK